MTALSWNTSRTRLLVVAAAILSAIASTGHDTAAQVRTDRLPQFTFAVEIEGLSPAGSFRQVSGLAVETEVIEFREGTSNTVRKLPGRTKWPNLVLKRGYTGDLELYEWATARTASGEVVRRRIAISLLDQAGNPVNTWHFEQGWPAKWELSELDASKNEVPIETLEIAHEGMSLVRDE